MCKFHLREFCLSPLGENLKPLIILKRKTIPKRYFPKDVIIQEIQKNGCASAMLEWLEEVYCKCKGKCIFSAILYLKILDSMEVYFLNTVDVQCQKLSTSFTAIPSRLMKMKILQQLDMTINRVFNTKCERSRNIGYRVAYMCLQSPVK